MDNSTFERVEEFKYLGTTLTNQKQSHYRPGQDQRVLRNLRFPDFVTTAQDHGRLSALLTGRLYPPEIMLVLISVRG
jgi:hypothetical protein